MAYKPGEGRPGPCRAQLSARFPATHNKYTFIGPRHSGRQDQCDFSASRNAADLRGLGGGARVGQYLRRDRARDDGSVGLAADLAAHVNSDPGGSGGIGCGGTVGLNHAGSWPGAIDRERT